MIKIDQSPEALTEALLKYDSVENAIAVFKSAHYRAKSYEVVKAAAKKRAMQLMQETGEIKIETEGGNAGWGRKTLFDQASWEKTVEEDIELAQMVAQHELLSEQIKAKKDEFKFKGAGDFYIR